MAFIYELQFTDKTHNVDLHWNKKNLPHIRACLLPTGYQSNFRKEPTDNQTVG